MLMLHYDITSLPAVVAALRLQRLADEGGHVVFNGVDVLGVDATIPVTLDQLEEFHRWREPAAALGLKVRRPFHRPPTLSAHLVATIASASDLGAAWREAIFAAYWTDGAPIGERSFLAALAGDIGLDAREVTEHLDDPAARVTLRRRMTADRGRGVGGVPVLELNGTFVTAHVDDYDLRELAGL